MSLLRYNGFKQIDSDGWDCAEILALIKTGKIDTAPADHPPRQIGGYRGGIAMGMMDFLKKPRAEAPFAETAFECKRGSLTIEGGARGFGKKHDVITHLRRFAGRNEM